MAGLEPVIFSGITVIPLIQSPVILNGISRSHSAGLVGHFERDYAPCVCGSGKTLAKCHKKTVGLFIQPKSIMPTFSHTGKSHPKCLLAYTQNCDEKISGEHMISASILRQLSKGKILLEGKDLRREFAINSDAIKTNIYCRRHNTSLGPLDSEAGRLLRSILDIDKSLVTSELNPQKAHYFSGHDIERWLLKTMIACFHGRISKVTKDTHILEAELIKRLDDLDWPDLHGFYVKTTENGELLEMPLESRVEISLVTKHNMVSGINFTIAGLQLMLIVSGSSTEIEAFTQDFSYRPSQLVFYKGNKVRVMGFQWTNYNGDQAIEIAKDDRSHTLPQEGDF
jgi:hypothetical protein